MPITEHDPDPCRTCSGKGAYLLDCGYPEPVYAGTPGSLPCDCPEGDEAREELADRLIEQWEADHG